MHRFVRRTRLVVGLWVAVASAVASPTPARAQVATVSQVVVEREGRTVTDPFVLSLIETKVGQPLSPRDVRETIAHLISLDAFEDVRVVQETAPGGGVLVRFVLVPAHPVDHITFEGALGVSEGDLRRLVVDQFGVSPRAAQAGNATQALLAAFRDRGYPQATVTARVVESHNPDRSTMVFAVQSGPRAQILDLRLSRTDEGPQPLIEQPNVRRGDAYDKASVDRALQRWVDTLRARGYYEARASHGVLFPGDGAVVSITLSQGPLIRVAFMGDALNASDRQRLVPIEAESSADEDLLEDSARGIEAFLKGQGYRDARVEYERVPGDQDVTITFMVDRGPRYEVGAVRVSGNSSVPTMEVRSWLRLSEGQVFAEDVLGRGAAGVRGEYRVRGFSRVQVQTRQVVVAPERATSAQRRIDVELQIVEGGRTAVRAVTFEGATVLSAAALQALVAMPVGQPFADVAVITARDRIDLEYRNRGYDQVVVQSTVTLADGDTQADVRFTLVEGPQIMVDRVLIVGTSRTNPETIRRELLLKPGAPLGYAATVESRGRLAALGLFRRITIEEIAHGVEPRRDILIRVEESPATTVSGGGGVEGAFRPRTDSFGQAEDRFELVPRGFFQVGRRNLWGKNRVANLFTRVSVRNRDVGLNPDGTPASESTAGGGAGFNEYRIVGTFREPRIFGSVAEVLVTGILEQAIRSSFNFARREMRVEAGLRMPRGYSVSGRYSFDRTELFDRRFSETEGTLIDRLFPQVRLSTFTGSFIRDSRDDLLDAAKGRLVTVTSDLAARAIGSEVGFSKTYVEVFSFHRLPSRRRAVLALGARVGAANGFRREVVRLDQTGASVLDPSGTPVVDVIETIPVSRRFFAGGDTTVRGFSLDRLGDAETISASGFPTGGNGVIVLNGEMRVGVVGPLQAVGFLDAGNVAARASELSLGKLRTAAGFGIRFRSPVGPIRLDLGFKLDRRELSPGRLERRSVWHISFGQAF